MLFGNYHKSQSTRLIWENSFHSTPPHTSRYLFSFLECCSWHYKGCHWLNPSLSRDPLISLLEGRKVQILNTLCTTLPTPPWLASIFYLWKRIFFQKVIKKKCKLFLKNFLGWTGGVLNFEPSSHKNFPFWRECEFALVHLWKLFPTKGGLRDGILFALFVSKLLRVSTSQNYSLGWCPEFKMHGNTLSSIR